MRNLNSYNGSTHTFLDEVLASKKNSQTDPKYKERLKVLTPNVKLLFNNFDISHSTNNHISLTPYGYSNQDKDDLLKLYTSKNKRLIHLKYNVTTVLDNRAMNTCQYCSIAPISSLDHIVPKSTFPEFSVNPKNLLPACSICNSYKSENWKENNKTLFLNLYTDAIPKEQFLFVDLIISSKDIEPTFNLRNINNIDLDFFELLESHYSKLYLPIRFKRESNKIISELTHLIIASKDYLSKEQIIEIIKTKIIEDKNTFGSNYYKSILEEALINKEDFMESLLN